MVTFEETQHPGVYIKEEMKARGWLQRDLAFILGCKEQAINPLLSGKRGVSPEMAKALGHAFDMPAKFFLNLQNQYDLRQASEPNLGVAIRAKMQSTYPVREMIKRGWIEEADAHLLQAQLVRFFEVNSLDDVPYLTHAAVKYAGRSKPMPVEDEDSQARILLRTILAEAERTGSWTVPVDIQERIRELFR